MRSVAGQPVSRGAANATGSARDQRHLAVELFGRRGELELVQLQRPVFDVVRFVLGQALEPAQRHPGPQHFHSAVVQLAADVRVPDVFAGRDHAQARDQDHARGGAAQLVALVFVALEIGFVLALVSGDAVAQLLLERVDALRRAPVDEQREALDVHEVIRARHAALADRPGVAVADHIEDLRRLIDLEDRRPVPGYRAANARQDLRQDGAALGLGQRRHHQLAEHAPAAGLVADVRLGLLNDADRAGVTRRAVRPPGDQPVLAHDHAFQPGVIADALANPLAEREAGADVRHEGRAVAVQGACGLGGLGHRGEADDRVRVGVVDVGGRGEGMQQCFDALARAPRLERRPSQVIDHLLVGHGFTGEKRLDLVQAEQGELRLGDRQDIRAGRFDRQHHHLAPDVVGHAQLGAGVAAENVDDSPVAPEQVAAIDQSVEIGQLCRFRDIPKVLRHDKTPRKV